MSGAGRWDLGDLAVANRGKLLGGQSLDLRIGERDLVWVKCLVRPEPSLSASIVSGQLGHRGAFFLAVVSIQLVGLFERSVGVKCDLSQACARQPRP